MRPLVFVVIMLFAVLSASVCEAQWTAVSDPVFRSPYTRSGGAMTYWKGVVWAGAADLWKSTDAGMTWTRTNMPPSRVYDIAGYNDSIIAVATEDRGVLVTTDQGVTWRDIHGRTSSKVSFGNDSLTVLSSSAYEFVRTTTFGQPWQTLPTLFTAASFRKRADTLYHIGDHHLYYSSDNGATWQATAGLFDRDCWDFALDSCDRSRFYVMNEELYLYDDMIPAIYTTSNTGSTWSQTSPFGHYCGNITTSSQQIFVQTYTDGIIESGDAGASWSSIGGPNGANDQTLVAVVEDSILLAADTSGVMWRTRIPNSTPTATPSELFAEDTVELCDPALSHRVTIHARCASIDSATFRTAAYRIDTMITGIALDTISIAFKPDSGGTFPDTLRVYLSSGSVLTVPLGGSARTPLVVRTSNAQLSATAIGEDLHVPVVLSNAAFVRQLAFTIDYDTIPLEFEHAELANGVALTVDKSSPGHLLVSGVSDGRTNGDTIAYIDFRWFPQYEASTVLHIDSLSVDGLGERCLVVADAGASVRIDGADDCANSLISTFMRYGAKAIELRPNPASNVVTLSGLVHRSIYRVWLKNMLGHIVLDRTLEPTAPGAVMLSLQGVTNGVYEIECQDAALLDVPRRGFVVIAK